MNRGKKIYTQRRFIHLFFVVMDTLHLLRQWVLPTLVWGSKWKVSRARDVVAFAAACPCMKGSIEAAAGFVHVDDMNADRVSQIAGTRAVGYDYGGRGKSMPLTMYVPQFLGSYDEGLECIWTNDSAFDAALMDDVWTDRCIVVSADFIKRKSVEHGERRTFAALVRCQTYPHVTGAGVHMNVIKYMMVDFE